MGDMILTDKTVHSYRSFGVRGLDPRLWFFMVFMVFYGFYGFCLLIVAIIS